MFKNVSRSKTMRSFDPALLCRRGIALTTRLPVLPKKVTDEIIVVDQFDRKDFGEKILFCLGPAIIVVAGLLALIAPLPQ